MRTRGAQNAEVSGGVALPAAVPRARDVSGKAITTARSCLAEGQPEEHAEDVPLRAATCSIVIPHDFMLSRSAAV